MYRASPRLAACRRRILVLVAAFHAGKVFDLALWAAAIYAFAIGIPLLGVGLGLCAFLFWPFPPRSRRAPEESPEILAEAEAPELYALVRGAADRMGVRCPVEIVLTPDADASCTEVGPLLGTEKRCRTEIGLALLQGMEAADLEAFLALHLVHQADGDLLLRRIFHRTWEATGELAERSPFLRPAVIRLRDRLAAAMVEWDEIHLREADAAAAQAMGSIRYKRALRRAARINRAFEHFLRDEIQAIADEGWLPADLYAGFRLFLAAEGEPEESETFSDSFRERLARLDAITSELEPLITEEGRRPARTLLGDPAAAEARLAELRIPRPKGEIRGTVRWEEVSDRVWSPRMRKAAARFRNALPPGTTLSWVLEWIGHSSHLALAVAVHPEVLEPANAQQRDDYAFHVLRHGIGAWIGVELVDRGWRWKTGPGRPLEVEGPAGERFAPMAWAGHALRDREGAAQLREELAVLGLLEHEPEENVVRKPTLLH